MKPLIAIFMVAACLLAVSCSRNHSYSVGVFNNTEHQRVKIKIQYPSPRGMKRIRFSMINVGEFSSNQYDTKIYPIPPEAKITWVNSEGSTKNAVIDLSFVKLDGDEEAIIIDIDEHGAVAEHLDAEQFSGEWEKRLVRKGYK